MSKEGNIGVSWIYVYRWSVSGLGKYYHHTSVMYPPSKVVLIVVVVSRVKLILIARSSVSELFC